MGNIKNLNVFQKLKNKIAATTGIVALTVVTGAASLTTACTKTNNNTTPEPTGIEYDITPTDEVTPIVTVTTTPTPEVTSTPTPTPEPTATPTPTPTPLPSYKDIKVSVEELRINDIIAGEFFGVMTDVDEEMSKRKDYLRSFNILSDNEIDIIVTYLNLCFLANDDIDRDVAQKYVSICNKETLNKSKDIIEKIMQHNFKNPDNQIVISWIGIDDALNTYDRIKLNDIQYHTYKVANGETGYKSKINPDTAFTFYIYDYKGNSKNISCKLDDLSTPCKFTMLCIPWKTLEKLKKEDLSAFGALYKNTTKDIEMIESRLLNFERIKTKTLGYTQDEMGENWY